MEAPPVARPVSGIVEVPGVVPSISLFVPGDRPERFAKAQASGADAVILDLEDAVAPENKNRARESVRRHSLDPEQLFVRANAADTPDFHRDLEALATVSLRGIMLPKAETPAQIAAVRKALPSAQLVLLIETAAGIDALRVLSRCDGVTWLAFGSLDIANDLGCAPSWEALLAARSALVLESRLAGLPNPIDGVNADFGDERSNESEARRARELGFGGKLIIHPKQVAPTRAGLRPSAQELRWAEQIVASVGGGGAGAMSGTMVDRPVVLRAQQILARAAALRP